MPLAQATLAKAAAVEFTPSFVHLTSKHTAPNSELGPEIGEQHRPSGAWAVQEADNRNRKGRI